MASAISAQTTVDFDKSMQYFLLCPIHRNINSVFLVPMVLKIITRMHRKPVLSLPTPNTDCFYESAIYFGIQNLKILAVCIRNSVTLVIFKTNVKQYLFV